MAGTLIRSQDPVTLLGASPLPAGALETALARAPRLVAADGGALAALDAGHVPEAVIGDLDSLPTMAATQLPPDRVHRIPEQATTDFDKSLRNIEAPLVLGVGFLGARLDHELAAMNVLVRKGQGCILLGTHDLVFAAPRRLALPLAPGTRVSLFPMAPVTGTSEGLDYPIDMVDFHPAGMTGTSNRANGPVRLSFTGRGMLVILPLETLDLVIEALVPRVRGVRRNGPRPVRRDPL